MDSHKESQDEDDDMQSLEDTVAQVVHSGSDEVSTSSPQEPPSQRLGDTSVEIHDARSSRMIEKIVENPKDMNVQDLMVIPEEVLQIIPLGTGHLEGQF